MADATRILIADDNAQVRAAMREVLEASGEWEIIEAENGDQAVVKAQECLPRLVILDLVMPGKDGFIASREIAKLLPGTRVLMHTLYSSPQIKIEAAKSGIRKVVQKSESSALVSAVREALEPDARRAPDSARVLDIAQSEVDPRWAEDRIRELCVQVIAADDSASLETKLAELRDALHRHVEQFRARLIEYPAISERRSRNGVSQAEAELIPEMRENSGPGAEVVPISDAEADRPSNPPPKARNGTQ
jgi:DNA-binding NarL/FixJ family response regulator